MEITIHPLDLKAVRMLATDVLLLSQRAKRLGVPSASATLELVSDVLEHIYDKELIERNAEAARQRRPHTAED